MSLNGEKIQAILFDIDGTLSNSDDQMVANLERLLTPLRILFSKETVHAAARWLVMALESPGNFFYNLADRLDLDSLFIRLLHDWTRRKKHRIKTFWIIPGAKKMLSRLAKKFPLAVVSARDEASSLAFINQFELSSFFKVVVTSQTCHYTKPFPDPLLYAARKLNIHPENCLMVGDTTVDMRAAKLAGMQALGVLCGFGTRRELLRAGADLVLDSPVELLRLPGMDIQAGEIMVRLPPGDSKISTGSP